MNPQSLRLCGYYFGESENGVQWDEKPTPKVEF
jgi:hypothetical protein